MSHMPTDSASAVHSGVGAQDTSPQATRRNVQLADPGCANWRGSDRCQKGAEAMVVRGDVLWWG